MWPSMALYPLFPKVSLCFVTLFPPYSFVPASLAFHRQGEPLAVSLPDSNRALSVSVCLHEAHHGNWKVQVTTAVTTGKLRTPDDGTTPARNDSSLERDIHSRAGALIQLWSIGGGELMPYLLQLASALHSSGAWFWP
jgi:hypothetical protein